MIPALMILYAVGGLVFAGVALSFMRGEREPWAKSILWSVLIGTLWPVAFGVVIYHFFSTRWI